MREKSLEEALFEFKVAIEKQIGEIETDKTSVQYLESVLKNVPDLKHSAIEIAEIIDKTTKYFIKQTSNEIVDKASEKYIGRVALHIFASSCVENYDKDNTNIFDDVVAAIKYLKTQNIIEAENGHIVLPLRYENKDKQSSK